MDAGHARARRETDANIFHTRYKYALAELTWLFALLGKIVCLKPEMIAWLYTYLSPYVAVVDDCSLWLFSLGVLWLLTTFVVV